MLSVMHGVYTGEKKLGVEPVLTASKFHNWWLTDWIKGNTLQLGSLGNMN